MEFWFLVAAMLLVGLTMSLTRAATNDDEPEDHESTVVEHRIAHILNSLSGDVEHDRLHLNQLLSLGAQVVPHLIADLRIGVSEDTVDPLRLALVEKTIVDLGLASVPYLLPELVRLKDASRLTPHLVRILQQLSRLDASAIMRHVIHKEEITWCLTHILRYATEASLSSFLLACPETYLSHALDTLAPQILEGNTVVSSVLARGSDKHRLILLQWIQRWAPANSSALLLESLADPRCAIRQTAIAGARLITDTRLLPELRALGAVPSPLQRYAIDALVAQGSLTEHHTYVSACQSDDAHCVASALCALTTSCNTTMSHRWLPSQALPGALAQGIRDQVTVGSLPMQTLFDCLESTYTPFRRFIIHVISLRAMDDGRARERLIRLTEDAHWPSRVWAILSLAKIKDPTVPELFANTLRATTDETHMAIFQEAAQHIGHELIPSLLRRFSMQEPAVAKRLLCVARGLPLGDHCSKLLHVLDDVHEPGLVLDICHTIRLAGPHAHRYVQHVLTEKTRGLMAPALRYLAVHGQEDDVAAILSVYDTQRNSRELSLSILEFIGAPAIHGIIHHIELGGDDQTLLTLEHRLHTLERCLEQSENS
jgi:hypothetical protein